jgi:hypothetical protein
MQSYAETMSTQSLAVSHGVGRSLTVADVCLCLVPISLFLSIMSLV